MRVVTRENTVGEYTLYAWTNTISGVCKVELQGGISERVSWKGATRRSGLMHEQVVIQCIT